MRPRARIRVLAAAAIAAGLLLPAAPPTGGAGAREYRLDLLRPGDFVTQHTDVACVGASVQMMLNILRPGADRSTSGQQVALRTAQKRSNPVYVKRSGGASAIGWAYALERLGGGPYRVRAYSSRTTALREVAAAIRSTGRPAGLLIWAGVHAWVVSGFRSTGDPATDPGFGVSAIIISDPWWPRPTNSRGRTLPPGSELTPAALARHFVLFQRGPRRGGSILNGSYVVILPVDPLVVAERAGVMR